MLSKVIVSSFMLPLSLIPFRYSDMLRILLSAVCLFPSMSTSTILASASILFFIFKMVYVHSKLWDIPTRLYDNKQSRVHATSHTMIQKCRLQDPAVLLPPRALSRQLAS